MALNNVVMRAYSPPSLREQGIAIPISLLLHYSYEVLTSNGNHTTLLHRLASSSVTLYQLLTRHTEPRLPCLEKLGIGLGKEYEELPSAKNVPSSSSWIEAGTSKGVNRSKQWSLRVDGCYAIFTPSHVPLAGGGRESYSKPPHSPSSSTSGTVHRQVPGSRSDSVWKERGAGGQPEEVWLEDEGPVVSLPAAPPHMLSTRSLTGTSHWIEYLLPTSETFRFQGHCGMAEDLRTEFKCPTTSRNLLTKVGYSGCAPL